MMSAADYIADYIQNLVDEVKAWQSNKGTQKIPNKHSKDTTEAKLGRRFEKLLLRRSRALGGKRSGRQLEPTEVALVNSVPGVPARGCSVHGEDAARLPDHGGAASGLGCAKATGPLERHATDKVAAAARIQEMVTASPVLLAIADEDTGEVRRLCHGRADLNAQDEVDFVTPL